MDGDQIPDEDAKRRYPDEEQQPLFAERLEAVERQHAHEHGEAGGFAGGGEEGDHRGRRALIDIRRPEVERRSRHLEEEADQHHEQRDKGERRQRGRLREHGQMRGTILHEEKADAVDEDRRSQRTEQQVLGARFRRARVLFLPGRERVEAERGNLQSQEDDYQVQAAHHHHQADGGEHE
ncbi:MAG: hypothetical protein BWY76_00440 [bacterium ADurb.Bin429]|nr:MAG: hypothetical protein BWY76_00440 [bacterium ADurb.Bin429]